MKPVLLAAVVLFAVQLSYGQKTEYSVHLNSGGYAYLGRGTVSTISINIPDVYPAPENGSGPYGKRLGLSYGAAAQIQRTTPKQSLFGVQAGYEVLRNQVGVDKITGFRFVEPASGYIRLTNKTINLHPYFGRRLSHKTVDLDLTAGPEFGLILSTREQQKITLLGETTRTDNTRADSYIDLRARINLTAYYKRVGLSTGYSVGLTNYNDDADGDYEVYSQFVRLGLAYRL